MLLATQAGESLCQVLFRYATLANCFLPFGHCEQKSLLLPWKADGTDFCQGSIVPFTLQGPNLAICTKIENPHQVGILALRSDMFFAQHQDRYSKWAHMPVLGTKMYLDPKRVNSRHHFHFRLLHRKTRQRGTINKHHFTRSSTILRVISVH
jgi:hypothetical protein